MMNVKLLSAKDWEYWKQLRLGALKDSPTSFSSSFEEESNCSDTKFQEDLIKNNVFGTFVDCKLVACAGFYSLNFMKVKHRGILWGTYTKPEYRRHGMASSIIKTIVIHAKNHVKQLHLTCVTINTSAIALYQKQEFKIYGTEPNSLRVGDRFFDEHLMVLAF